jgi:hypothetical protein
VHSSAAAFSHFGVTIEAPRVERPAPPATDQRVVARSPRQTQRAEKVEKTAACPEAQRGRVVRV